MTNPSSNEHVEQISENIQLVFDGLPRHAMSGTDIASVAMAAVSNGLPFALTTGGLVTAVVKTVILKVGRDVYEIRYQARMLRVMTALDVYSDCLAYIDFQERRGRFDPELSSDARNHIRQKFKREFPTR